ncbi:MAG TPA: glycosyltransferase [Vicinamibacterales bacterium]|nr:glycosyltransferase [Vicinamibacterales bacterium]
MATIAVVTSAPPLTEGGHLVIARALERALLAAGHRAGIVTTPANRFGRQASGYVATWLTDVGMTGAGERVDQVISLRFPSYAVRHPRHVCWLNHTMREYYDLWERFSGALSKRGRLKEQVRRAMIRRADSWLLQRVSRVYAQSETVRGRLRTWNGVDAEVLYPPPPPRPYRCDGYGDFVLFTSRLTPLKRADLLVRALAEPAASGVRCRIAGEGDERPALEALIRQLGIANRVTFTGYLSDEALVDALAGCRAVVFPPMGEDYGFVTVEAFASSKAVITCTDSGGPAELVKDGVNGFVTAPEPAALARALSEVAASADLAAGLGREAQATASTMTWADVVSRLVIV